MARASLLASRNRFNAAPPRSTGGVSIDSRCGRLEWPVSRPGPNSLGHDQRGTMELGITTFAETYPDPRTGETISHAERLRQVVAEAEMTEQVRSEERRVGKECMARWEHEN